MKFNNRENICHTTVDGKRVWESRNVAVCIEVLRVNPKDESQLQIIAVLRGSDLYQPNKWCFPCGYLDWDEDVVDAARREVFEETGIILQRDDLEIYDVDSNPHKALQNVTIHFRAFLMKTDQEPSVTNDEVQSGRWLNLKDAAKLSWAFDHEKRVNKIISNG